MNECNPFFSQAVPHYDLQSSRFFVNELELFGEASPCVDFIAPGRDSSAAFAPHHADRGLPRQPFQHKMVKEIKLALEKKLLRGLQ